MAENREEAGKAFALFLDKYEVKYPQAAECLEKDREELLAFYDFPAEPWKHIRTTNPIESTFATVRGSVRQAVIRYKVACLLSNILDIFSLV